MPKPGANQEDSDESGRAQGVRRAARRSQMLIDRTLQGCAAE